MKLLCSGNWSSGSVTVTGIQNYNAISCDVATPSGTSNNRLIAFRTISGSFVGVGGSINGVSGNSYGLRYEELIAPLVKMVQYQQKEIETMKSQLESLI